MSALCSVCFVRAQRDDDDFLPCSPRCFQAALAEGYAAGVQAARDAVHRMDWMYDEGCANHVVQVDDALAAIDALREEQK